jgi:hypothetical protein
MNFKKRYLQITLPTLIFISSCTGLKTVSDNKPLEISSEVANLQESVLLYQSTEDRALDIIHTKLVIDFNWQKKQMNGVAFLTLNPFYY